jgi:4a-hydroxytetrahydrobiopterin dehydratase
MREIDGQAESIFHVAGSFYVGANTAFDPTERGPLLQALPLWPHDTNRDAIVRAFEVADFLTAINFINVVALIAPRSDHHPEWSNIYTRIHILLSTHEAHGLSVRDIEMVQAIDDASVSFLKNEKN